MMKNKTRGFIGIGVAIFALIATLSASLFYIYENNKTPTVGGGSGTITSLPIKTFLGLTDTPNSYSGQGGKTVSVKSDASGLEFSSAGGVTYATSAEINTGTETAKVISPDTLAGSNLGTKIASIQAIDGATVLTTGDGKVYFRIPSALNGMNLVMASCQVITTSSSGTPTMQFARGRQYSPTSDFTYVDMLSTRITIDATEYDSKDATTSYVIDTSNDDIATGDVIRLDVDVAGTGTKGLNCTNTFQLP